MNKKSNLGFTLIELLVVISIIAVLASIALPVFTSVQERGFQTKDLSNAKQIGLACKLYAADHDGLFPDKDGQAADPPAAVLDASSKSNQAFGSLIPAYLPAEKLFYLGKSAWSTAVPDENIADTKRCEAGTNNFAYVLGLNETSNPSFPLLADAPKTGGALAEYSTVQTDKGGVWKGKKAIVIRCDQSGNVESTKIAAAKATVPGKTGAAATADDIFVPDAVTGWLVGNTLLLPQ